MTTREEEEFNAAFDERGMLKDGITHLKVPLRMIDSADDYEVHHFRGRVPLQVDSPAWNRAIADARARLKDRQPGFTTRDAVVRDALNDCYDAYDQGISEAWRAPPTGVGSHGPRGQQEGDFCTIDGAAGRLRSINGTLECVPDRRAGAVRPHGVGINKDAKDAEYERYDVSLRDAWRRAQ